MFRVNKSYSAIEPQTSTFRRRLLLAKSGFAATMTVIGMPSATGQAAAAPEIFGYYPVRDDKPATDERLILSLVADLHALEQEQDA